MLLWQHKNTARCQNKVAGRFWIFSRGQVLNGFVKFVIFWKTSADQSKKHPPIVVLHSVVFYRLKHVLRYFIARQSSPQSKDKAIFVRNIKCWLCFGFGAPRNDIVSLPTSFSAIDCVFSAYHTGFQMYSARRIHILYHYHFCCSFTAHFWLSNTRWSSILHRQKWPTNEQKMGNRQHIWNLCEI